jgi:DNA polymerase III delta subunit
MVTLFVGVEDYLRTEGAKRLIDQLVPPNVRDFGLEIIDATCDKSDAVDHALNQLEEALYTESFFSENGKTVWLRDANFLPGNKIRGSEHARAKAWFNEFLPNTPLPEGHHLIISAEKCPATSAFYKWIAKHGKIELCGTEVRSYETLKVGIERLEGMLPTFNLKMNQEVKELFIGRIGINVRTLMSELEKLRLYLGSERNEVLLEDVSTITSLSAMAEPFDIVNLIQQRAAGVKAVKTLELLRADKNLAFPTANMIVTTLNDLCALRDALDRGWYAGERWEIPTDNVPTRLQKLNGFMAKKAVEGAKRYTLNELRAARHYAIEMRWRLVDSSLDPFDIIEPTLLRILARQQR